MVCHQIPERSLWAAGRPLPLCARCTGIYLGAFILITAVCAAYAASRGCVKPLDLTAWAARRTAAAGTGAVLLLAPMITDAAGQLLGLWSSGAAVRLAVGGLFGFGLSAVFLAASGYNARTGCINLPTRAGWAAGAAAVVLPVLLVGVYNEKLPWLPPAAASVAGIALLFGTAFWRLLRIVTRTAGSRRAVRGGGAG